MRYIQYKGLLLAAIVAVIAVSSCKKDYDPDFELSRPFTPSGFQITENETDVKVAWAPSLFSQGKDMVYTIEVSKNAAFTGTIDYTKVVDTTFVTITNTELVIRQPYYARVKAKVAGSDAESGWVVSSSFRIRGEQFFEPILQSDVTDIGVRLKWRPTPGLTKITLTPDGGSTVDYVLTPGDLTALQKIITGLQPGKMYTAEIFAGTLSKGLSTFTTRPSLGTGIIDLRGITGVPSILTDTLPDIASGSIVVLKKGETYNVSSTFDLSKSVKIMAGYDFSTAPAVIFMNSNFNIVANSNIDSIVFSDVTLKSDSYSGKYVFNINRACTIGKIKFDGCRAEIFRGVTRLQAATISVTDFIVENSIMDSLSNYGVLTVDATTCKVSNITFRNSTIYKAERILVSRQNSTKVIMENCTFNEAPSGDNYLIHYNTSGTDQVTNGITIANCIMGVGKPNATGSRAVRGIRANASVTVTNTYNTSDYTLVAPNPPAPPDPYPISNLIPYGAPSTTLFQAPADGNFKIVDNNFPGRSTAGDPRWR